MRLAQRKVCGVSGSENLLAVVANISFTNRGLTKVKKLSVAVVTATTGRQSLVRAIESVKNQTYPCRHYVFVDGMFDVPAEAYGHGVNFIQLPVSTGSNGYMNAGIIAASAYLVPDDLICWLDDDNWFEPEHVESLLTAIEGKSYAYSLRKLVTQDGQFFANDDWESLGHHGEHGLIDVNCYLMSRALAVQIAPAWYQQQDGYMVGDRYMFASLKANNIPYGTSGKYTVNYTLGAKKDLRAWFRQGNAMNYNRYDGQYPWAK